PLFVSVMWKSSAVLAIFVLATLTWGVTASFSSERVAIADARIVELEQHCDEMVKSLNKTLLEQMKNVTEQVYDEDIFHILQQFTRCGRSGRDQLALVTDILCSKEIDLIVRCNG